MGDKINKQKFYIYESNLGRSIFKVVKEGTILHEFVRISFIEMVEGYNHWFASGKKEQNKPHYIVESKEFELLCEKIEPINKDKIELFITSSQKVCTFYKKGSAEYLSFLNNKNIKE